VVIRHSSAKQLDTLIANLGADRSDVRDAAIARIAVIGVRAVERLVAVVEDSTNALSRVAALHALEGIGGTRALDVALKAINDANVNVAIAAIGVTRGFVKGARGVDVIDRLMALSLDRGIPDAVRGAAVRALDVLDAKTVAPLRDALRNDPEPAVAALATSGESFEGDASAWLRDVAEGQLTRRRESRTRGGQNRGRVTAAPAPAATPGRRARTRTGRNRSPSDGMDAATRVIHLALAQRGSRLVLYDLRESLESTREPLPVEFLAALREIGDVSCLEPLAAAFFSRAERR
jgi:HEAT repeat protein